MAELWVDSNYVNLYYDNFKTFSNKSKGSFESICNIVIFPLCGSIAIGKSGPPAESST